MVIAIDGPAGSGKSTVAKKLAGILGMPYLNSGLIYRYFSKLSLEKPDLQSQDLVKLVEVTDLALSQEGLLINGVDPKNSLHTVLIDKKVGEISSIQELRESINNKIRELSKTNDFLVEGRDTTTLMFPETPFKFYIDASSKVRAQRRFNQGLLNTSLDEIEADIIRRDDIDKNKSVGALKINEDAHYIDSSVLTIEKVCDIVLESIQGKTHSQHRG